MWLQLFQAGLAITTTVLCCITTYQSQSWLMADCGHKWLPFWFDMTALSAADHSLLSLDIIFQYVTVKLPRLWVLSSSQVIMDSTFSLTKLCFSFSPIPAKALNWAEFCGKFLSNHVKPVTLKLSFYSNIPLFWKTRTRVKKVTEKAFTVSKFSQQTACYKS